jgi:hypothetical protein
LDIPHPTAATIFSLRSSEYAFIFESSNDALSSNLIATRCQSFERIVLSLELLVVEDDVHVPVAGGAQTYRTVNLPPVERLLVSLVLVARPGDEVVPGQLSHRALTQLARAAVSVAHIPMLASAEATPM